MLTLNYFLDGEKARKVPSSWYAKWNDKINGLYNIKSHSKNISNSIFYLIMADEMTDGSNKEQLVICFRWLIKVFYTHEEFIGIYCFDNIKANTLVTVIKDILIRLNTPLSNARGQCYDVVKNICVVLKMMFLIKNFQKIQKHFSHNVLDMP